LSVGAAAVFHRPGVAITIGGMVPEEFGSYLVYERLGTGGMANVHRAQSRNEAGTPIALKRLLPQLSLMPEFVQAFLAEARLARHLKHVNVAQTYDFGKVGDTYYIAMELVRGPTLSQILQQCAATRREVPLPIALYLIVQLCDALEYAHNLSDPHGTPLGIIHRDVTPSNIIVSTTGIAKLIDFGIAKATSSEVRTKTGFIKGKFAYVAPEYIAGSRKGIDARVDLFAAGVIAHELMTMRRLFQVDNDMETLKRVQTLRIDPPSTWNARIPPALDDVVMTSLARNPDQRWQKASAMRNAFAYVAQKLPTSQQVAAWLEETMGPVRPSDASAVSIEIALIEEQMTVNARKPRFAEHLVTGPQRAQRTQLWALVAVLGLIVVALATYLVAR
jgi:eukaryotic-like serine/threonine-protein kinase